MVLDICYIQSKIKLGCNGATLSRGFVYKKMTPKTEVYVPASSTQLRTGPGPMPLLVGSYSRPDLEVKPMPPLLTLTARATHAPHFTPQHWRLYHLGVVLLILFHILALTLELDHLTCRCFLSNQNPNKSVTDGHIKGLRADTLPKIGNSGLVVMAILIIWADSCSD